MRISEGNIFEAMRLVLPEHREKMTQFERESRKASPPVLAPDKQYEMHCILETAIREGREIQITRFNPNENERLTGIPYFKGGKLLLASGNEIYVLTMGQIINIEET
jgi:hypothetical protein